MNEEVKEILDRLNNIPMGELYACCLEDSECKIILDFITNLQKENEKLTAESTAWESKYYDLQEEVSDLKAILESRE